MFRLAKVLRYKERLEREARVQRAVGEKKLADLEQAVAGLRRDRAALPDTTGYDFETLVHWARYAEGLRRREDRVLARIDQLRPAVADLVKAHLDIRREVEGLRKLRQRTWARQRKRVERARQHSIDDAASRTFLPGSGTDFRPTGTTMDAWPRSDGPERPAEVESGPNRETEA